MKKQKENRSQKLANRIVNLVLTLAIILAAVTTYVSYVSAAGGGVPSIFGVRMFSIQTESMYPTLRPGDLIIDVKVKDADALEIGDIITYWTMIQGQRVLNTHGISQIYDQGEHRIFETKGKSNAVADVLLVHESEVVGKYVFRVGGLGKVFDYLQTGTGFFIVVVVPVFAFFLFYLVQFIRALLQYQNGKNQSKFERQRQQERTALEAELREKLRAELLASMAPEERVE